MQIQIQRNCPSLADLMRAELGQSFSNKDYGTLHVILSIHSEWNDAIELWSNGIVFPEYDSPVALVLPHFSGLLSGDDEEAKVLRELIRSVILMTKVV